ncbi:C13 family peptidase [Sphingomonas sp. RB56-2]|uniref:C13 family peptidase n=1 Tax=Sphingomonas brevis TaxID=2908206 RepID=A0ABT0S8G2_9SPHN|nr:C13 family peptidase [Sphingomonas brevis]
MSRSLIFTAALCAALLAGSAPAQQADRAAHLGQALSALQAQRPGIVDAYVVTVALDPDPVFNREAREAGRVLSQRFDAAGRTIVLAADEGADHADGAGSPTDLALVLGRISELMDRKEDVLVLYSTSHGMPKAGLSYRDDSRNSSVVTPAELAAMFNDRGIENRLIILQACFSGQFVPALAAPRTVIATAASATRTSFGCSAGNDWTFFGHALINMAMRQPDTFVRQFRRAFVTIYGWELKQGIDPSDPQIKVGQDAAGWLSALDARAPKTAGLAVGNPPTELAK